MKPTELNHHKYAIHNIKDKEITSPIIASIGGTLALTGVLSDATNYAYNHNKLFLDNLLKEAIAYSLSSEQIGSTISAFSGVIGGFYAIRTLYKSYKNYQYSKEKEQWKDILGIDLDNHVAFRGFKKDIVGNLVTNNFQSTQKPIDDTNDYISLKILENSICGGNTVKEILTGDYKKELDKITYNDAMNFNDMICVGGPIPLDFFKKTMDSNGKQALPCSYNISNAKPFSGHNNINQYEIITSKGEEFTPIFNKKNYGLITCIDKKLIFDGDIDGKLLNISGCQGVGTQGALKYFASSNGRKHILNKIKANNEKESFQLIVEVDLDAVHQQVGDRINTSPRIVDVKLIDKVYSINRS